MRADEGLSKVLRGPDLNREPPGYEPSELPLLYPAIIYVRNTKATKVRTAWYIKFRIFAIFAFRTS